MWLDVLNIFSFINGPIENDGGPLGVFLFTVLGFKGRYQHLCLSIWPKQMETNYVLLEE